MAYGGSDKVLAEGRLRGETEGSKKWDEGRQKGEINDTRGTCNYQPKD